MAERHDQRSSDEIRRDIEGTRTELRETVYALERKLSVGQIVDEVWDRFGGRRTAGAAVSNVGDTIRDHPVPLALMGLGVAWLAIDKATGSHPERDIGPGTYERAEGRVGPYRGDAVHESSGPSSMDKAKRKATDAAESVKGKAAAMASKAKDMASDAKDSLGSSDDGIDDDGHGWHRSADRAAEAADRAREAADRARGRAAHGASRARHGFQSMLDDQPLALGAVAFGLGLASGLAAPTTRWEDRTMGRSADTVKDEARSFVKDAAHDAKQVAAGAASAAMDEAERQSGQVKESASRVATEARKAARKEVHDRNLDPEGLKERATRSRDRTEERLTD
jgi:hypothetical protein